MRKLTLAVAVLGLLAFGASGFAAETKGALDGMTFKGSIGPKAAKKHYDDDLVFKDGTFLSTACEKFGFHAVPYTATTEGDKTTFEATATNEKGEKMEWKGEITGKMAKASIVNTDSAGKAEDWMYSGKVKPEGKAKAKAKK
jgi:hypothetical protein